MISIVTISMNQGRWEQIREELRDHVIDGDDPSESWTPVVTPWLGSTFDGLSPVFHEADGMLG